MARIRNDDAARTRWERFLSSPSIQALLAPVLQRHPHADEGADALFDAIGHDLSNPVKKAVRKEAFDLFLPTAAELTDIVHECEAIRQDYRAGSGKDQRLLNKGMLSLGDLYDHLYNALVEKGLFKANKGTDPRPLLRRAVTNLLTDNHRRRQSRTRTEYSLDQTLALQDESVLTPILTDDTICVEEAVIANDEDVIHSALNGLRDECLALGMLDDAKEFALLKALYWDCTPIAQIANSLGTSTGAVEKELSRTRRPRVVRRDALLAVHLVSSIGYGGERNQYGAPWSVPLPGVLGPHARDIAHAVIDPGPWIQLGTHDFRWVVCRLTRPLARTRGYLYLLGHDPRLYPGEAFVDAFLTHIIFQGTNKTVLPSYFHTSAQYGGGTMGLRPEYLTMPHGVSEVDYQLDATYRYRSTGWANARYPVPWSNARSSGFTYPPIGRVHLREISSSGPKLFDHTGSYALTRKIQELHEHQLRPVLVSYTPNDHLSLLPTEPLRNAVEEVLMVGMKKSEYDRINRDYLLETMRERLIRAGIELPAHPVVVLEQASNCRPAPWWSSE